MRFDRSRPGSLSIRRGTRSSCVEAESRGSKRLPIRRDRGFRLVRVDLRVGMTGSKVELVRGGRRGKPDGLPATSEGEINGKRISLSRIRSRRVLNVFQTISLLDA